MSASRHGLAGSSLMVETPPSRNKVMPRTSMPWARATSECASSCRSTEPKSSREATRARPQYIAWPAANMAGSTAVASEAVSRPTITNQPALTRTSMPNSLPIFSPPFTATPLADHVSGLFPIGGAGKRGRRSRGRAVPPSGGLRVG